MGFLFPPSFLFFKQKINKCRPEMTRETLKEIKKRVKGSEGPAAEDGGGLGPSPVMREEMKEGKDGGHRTEQQSGGWGCHGNGRRGGMEGEEDGMEEAEPEGKPCAAPRAESGPMRGN